MKQKHAVKAFIASVVRKSLLASCVGALVAGAFAQTGTTNGTFDHHTVVVAVSGLCQSPPLRSTNTHQQGSISVPLSFRASGCTNMSFNGTLNLDFPATTPPATISSSLNTIRFEPRLQVNASLNGGWSFTTTPANNTWTLNGSLSIDATDEVPGCGTDQKMIGPGISSGAHAMTLVRNCTTRSITFPTQQGTDLLYRITTSLSLSVLAPSNPAGSRVLFLVSVDVESFYRVSMSPGAMNLDLSRMDFDASVTNPPPQTVTLENDSATNLNFVVSAMTADGGTWLTFSPTNGTLAAHRSTNIVVTVNGALLPGDVTNKGTIFVSGNAANSPQKVEVEVIRPAQLIGLEVVQVVQDWSNSIPLISGKATIVRAHVQSLRTNAVRVAGRLRLFRGGTELAESPLRPFNPGGSIMATTNALDRRHLLNDSLNFRLPTNIVTGTLDLRVEADGMGCGEIAGVANDCAVRAVFEPNATPRMKFVGIDWVNSASNRMQRSPAQIRDLVPRLISCFPISELTFDISHLEWPGTVPPDVADVNAILAWYRVRDFLEAVAGRRWHYYGAVSGNQVQGLAEDLPGTASSGYLPSGNFVRGRHTHSHEIAHTFGHEHAPFCGASPWPGAPVFPYTAVFSGITKGTLGPMFNGSNALVYGFDTYSENVVSPYKYFELMSYCDSAPLDLWPSKFTYEGLRTNVTRLFGSAAAPAAAKGAMQSYLFVRGMVDFQNDTVAFLPFGKLASAITPPTLPPGEYTLQLAAANGALLQQIPFAPVRYHARGPEVTVGSFIVPVPNDPAIREVRVLRNGQPRAARAASPNAPTVRVVFPNGGESLLVDALDLQWTASDADGDALTFDVQFSTDGGVTWTSLALDWRQQHYPISRDFLRGTQTGLLRVTASDGFNTASDQSDGTFSVGNHSPEVAIQSPADQQLIFGNQQVVFEAAVYDSENGEAVPTVQWRSTRDGILGNGRQLFLAAANLSEGMHGITVSATDTTGATSEESVTIVVTRTVPARLADLVISQQTVEEGTVGVPMTFEVTVENRGPNDATGLVITDRLPPSLQDVSVLSAPGACTISNSLVRCVVNQLTAGATTVLRIQGTPPTTGTATNVADVTASETEPTPHDNAEILTVNVTSAQRPPLSIERLANSFVLSWPGTASGYILESSTTIPNPVPWNQVGGVTLVNGQNRATVSNTGGTLFFRLRKP